MRAAQGVHRVSIARAAHALGGALLLLACACERPRAAAPTRLAAEVHETGQFAVQSAGQARRVQLSLKSGMAAQLRSPRADEPVGPARLEVASVRAESAQIGAGFIPVGPTVVLAARPLPVDLSFASEGFHVRAGHHLVLAVEQAAPCPARGCWSVQPARYESARCVAQLAGPAARLQFGSLPGSGFNDSAAR